MTTSTLPSVLTALSAAVTAALALAGTDEYNQPAPVQVFDGPAITPKSYREFAVVGDNGDEDDDAESATVEQQWAGIGAQRRDEQLRITCAVVCWAGDTDMPTQRTRAFVLFGLIEDALRGDVRIGDSVHRPGWAEVEDIQLRQEQTTKGARVRVVFTVAVRTRI